MHADAEREKKCFPKGSNGDADSLVFEIFLPSYIQGTPVRRWKINRNQLLINTRGKSRSDVAGLYYPIASLWLTSMSALGQKNRES